MRSDDPLASSARAGALKHASSSIVASVTKIRAAWRKFIRTSPSPPAMALNLAGGRPQRLIQINRTDGKAVPMTRYSIWDS
jgi:hypothetical protein